MKLNVITRRVPTHGSVFLDHYAGLRVWALRLTDGDAEEAEDILHDAFVQFVRLAPELSKIENPGAYLNRLLRNLHLAHITRRGRMQYVYLDALEYDTIALTIPGAHPLRRRELEEELRWICAWTVSRRHDKRGASFLILRFFLGYLPSEICKLSVCGRESLEKGLQAIRAEIRKAKTGDGLRDQPHDQNSPLATWLTSTIFDSTGKGCLLPELLQQTLSEHLRDSRPIERELLAHLTSCSSCLERANRILNLTPQLERFIDPPSGPGGSGDAGNAELLLRRALRSNEEIYEHRPSRIELCVNAEPQMSISVQSPRTVLKADVNCLKPVNFIEAFSEQGIRLLYMPVATPEEGGEFQQRVRIGFSEGRELSVEILFRNPNPQIVVSYTDPLQNLLPMAFDAVPAQSATAQVSAWSALGEWIKDTCRPRRPFKAWSYATVLLLIFLLPATQDEQVTLNAEEVLHRVDLWERGKLEKDLVVHRTFRYLEAAPGPHNGAARTRQMRIEIWRNARQRTLRRLIDDKGRVEMSTTDVLESKPTHATAWEYVPDAESFRLLSGASRIDVEQEGSLIRLASPEASLRLNRANFHPLQETFRIDQSDITISELTNEIVPQSATPMRASQATPELAKPVLPTAAALDDTELSVREKLHALHADLDEDIRIEPTPTAIHVTGVIDRYEQRLAIQAALRNVSDVRVTLLSAAQAARHEHIVRVEAASAEEMAPPLMLAWLKAEWPDDDGRDRHVQEMLRAADLCNEHMLALRRLELRYPNSSNPRVIALERDHAYALADEAEMLLSLLPPARAVQEQPVPRLDSAALLAMTQRLNQDLEHLLTLHPAGSEEGGTGVFVERSRDNLNTIAQSVRILIP